MIDGVGEDSVEGPATIDLIHRIEALGRQNLKIFDHQPTPRVGDSKVQAADWGFPRKQVGEIDLQSHAPHRRINTCVANGQFKVLALVMSCRRGGGTPSPPRFAMSSYPFPFRSEKPIPE